VEEEPSGVIVIDKPADITSAKVVNAVKRTLNIKKAGHSGTLDPFATGVLVCCMNQATRLSRFFLHGKKTYSAVLHLGVTTDTQDLTGNVIDTAETVDVSEDRVRSVIKQFEGASLQKPPVISALKHKGTPLYKLARSGRPVQKPHRKIVISAIDILDLRLPLVAFEVCCSAGTYIRTLCHDIGKALGCGGHLKALRRIASSGFSINEAIPLSELDEQVKSGKVRKRIINMADALRGMPACIADSSLIEKIGYGKRLDRSDFQSCDVRETTDFMKIVDEMNRLCAVLEVDKKHDQYKYCGVFR